MKYEPPTITNIIKQNMEYIVVINDEQSKKLTYINTKLEYQYWLLMLGLMLLVVIIGFESIIMNILK